MGRILISKEDVVESFVRSSGPGGQNVNKVASCVMLIHKPTGIIIKCQEGRSQYQNRIKAWEMLEQALQAREDAKLQQKKFMQEKKRRQNRKRTLSSKEQMLANKKKQAIKKMNRKGASIDD
jgi:protein subunit release factor B